MWAWTHSYLPIVYDYHLGLLGVYYVYWGWWWYRVWGRYTHIVHIVRIWVICWHHCSLYCNLNRFVGGFLLTNVLWHKRIIHVSILHRPP